MPARSYNMQKPYVAFADVSAVRSLNDVLSAPLVFVQQ